MKKYLYFFQLYIFFMILNDEKENIQQIFNSINDKKMSINSIKN